MKAKLLPTALIIAVLVATPTVANVYAQTADNKPVETTKKETNNNDNEMPIMITNEPTPDPNVVLVENQEPTPTETPSPSPSPSPQTAVTLAQGQVIAETEHPESVVVASKTKTIDGQKVYKYMFDDGWKVYVRASDGTVIKVQDKKDKDHDCQNRHKHAVKQAFSQQTRKSETKQRQVSEARWDGNKNHNDDKRWSQHRH